jgi:hypothetical protein
MAAEAELALQNSGNAFDWYSSAMAKAIDIASVKYPMLNNDAAADEAGLGNASNARFVFTYIMAVTSQNMDVAANAKETDTLFGRMLDKIKAGDYTMPESWGTGDKRKAMGKNFAKFGPLVRAMRGIHSLRELPSSMLSSAKASQSRNGRQTSSRGAFHTALRDRQQRTLSFTVRPLSGRRSAMAFGRT